LAKLFHPLNVGRVIEGRVRFDAFSVDAGVVFLEVVFAGGRKGQFEFGLALVVNQRFSHKSGQLLGLLQQPLLQILEILAVVLGFERRIPGAGGQQVVEAHLYRFITQQWHKL
jgi:hypothetical protein